jgi:hypothetical protein
MAARAGGETDEGEKAGFVEDIKSSLRGVQRRSNPDPSGTINWFASHSLAMTGLTLLRQSLTL